MILMHALAYLPIVAAPAVAINLVVGLQRLLKLPRTALPAVTSANADITLPRPTWDTVSTHWNPFVTGILPIATSLAMGVLGLWPFAYLGWALIETDPDPGWAQQVPPWFGNPGYFLGFGIVGLFVAILGLIVLGGIGYILHASGKCLLWPEVCDLCDPPDDHTAHNNEDNDHEGHDDDE